MSEIAVRPYRASDVPALAALWQRTFGDSAELTDAFYGLLPDMGAGFAAFCGETPVGEAHLITDLELVSGGERRRMAYLYAVAVDDRFRGRGIGAALVNIAESYARERGFIFCGEPAEVSLFDWYGRISSLKQKAYRGKKTVPAAAGDVRAVSAGEYLALRDTLIGSHSTVRPGAAAMEFEESVCRIYGGGFFACDDGIVAAYPEGGGLKVCELVGDESAAAAAAYGLGLPFAEYSVSSAEGVAYLVSDAPFPPDVLWQMTFD